MIESFFLQQHRFPSITETAQSIRHARSTVHSYLHEMDKRGILVYDGKEKRIETDKMRKVDAETVFTPILGAVPCGTPQIEEENIEEYLPLPAAVRCRRIRILYELFSAPKQQINFFFSNSAVAVHEIELAFYLHIVHFKDCKVFFAFCHRLISKGYGIVFHHHIGDHRKVADRNDPMKAIQRKPVF